MTLKLPSIEITFEQLAVTAIERSERGVAILIIRDDTDKSFDWKEYKSAFAVNADKEKYTAENLQYILDVLEFAPYKLYVVRIDTTVDTMADALGIVEKNVKTGWVTVAGATTEDSTALVAWVKAKELEAKTYKGIVYKATKPDCKHVVDFHNEKVTFSDKRGQVTGEKYLPSLLGILASCNIERAATYYPCKNLKAVVEVADNDTAVNEGKFVLINDVDTVKIALGVNSMTTTNGTTNTEDMRYIDTVEVMDLIRDDIALAFKENYLGAYKNKYDNQVLLISAINSYFKTLANQGVLDNEYPNKVEVDVEAQRAKWVAAGKAEAEDWDDQTVKNHAYKRTVFLKADIKVLGAMENLEFKIGLF